VDRGGEGEFARDFVFRTGERQAELIRERDGMDFEALSFPIMIAAASPTSFESWA
jgi:hypothetical protein